MKSSQYPPSLPAPPIPWRLYRKCYNLKWELAHCDSWPRAEFFSLLNIFLDKLSANKISQYTERKGRMRHEAMIQRRAKEQARQICNCPKTRSPQSPAPAIPNEQQFLLLSLLQRLVSLCDTAFGLTHLCPENQEEEDANSSYIQTTRFALPSLQNGLLLRHWMHQATRAQLQPPRA